MLRRSVLALGAITLVPAAPALGAEPGNYVALGGGVNVAQDADATGPGIATEAEFDAGFAVTMALGHRYENNVRLEIENGYRENQLDAGGGAGGEVRIWNLMANAYYDYVNETRFTPYIGGGVGFARTVYHEVTLPGGVGTASRDHGFAFQAVGGVSYDLGRNLQLYTEYRYFSTDDPDLNTPAGVKFESENRNHGVLAGLRWTFGPMTRARPRPAQPQPVAEVRPEPQARPAPPPPPPETPPIPRSYLVFFDFDRDEVRPDAMEILSEAVQNVRRGGFSEIRITGHADRAGPDPYNMRLSERRARNVATALAGLGIPPAEIGVEWRGERSPLVPTPDGVREPQNRRVEIVLP